MCHCIFFGINPCVSKHHAFHLYHATNTTFHGHSASPLCPSVSTRAYSMALPCSSAPILILFPHLFHANSHPFHTLLQPSVSPLYPFYTLSMPICHLLHSFHTLSTPFCDHYTPLPHYSITILHPSISLISSSVPICIHSI